MEDGRPPQTADGDAFRFRAGHLSLDLCSTLLWRYQAPSELLQAPADLARWLSEAGVCPAPATVSDEALRSARMLRESIYALVHDRLGGRTLAQTHVATLNAVAARPDPVPCVAAGGELAWSAADPESAALSSVARDAIELLTGPSAARLGECAAPDCAFLFLDTSRPGRRRWCAMNRCGNRQHVREHRRRQRLDSPTESAPEAPRERSKHHGR
jgi:predicted RNA-binding Zn ribbon-like protein